MAGIPQAAPFTRGTTYHKGQTPPASEHDQSLEGQIIGFPDVARRPIHLTPASESIHPTSLIALRRRIPHRSSR